MKLYSTLILFSILAFAFNCSSQLKSAKPQKEQGSTKTNKPEEIIHSNVIIPDISGDLINGWIPEKLITKKCKKNNFVYLDGSTEKPFNETTFYFFTYQGHLGFYLQCFDTDIQHLVYTHNVRDAAIWQDDNIEIILNSDPSSTDNEIKICINPIGTFLDAKGTEQDKWNSNLKVTSNITDKAWVIQALLPLKDIGTEAQLKTLKGNISRTRYGRGNTFAEDTAWKKTNSMRANVPQFYESLPISSEAFQFQAIEIPKTKLSDTKISDFQLAKFFQNSIDNQVIISKTGDSNAIIDGQLIETEWKYNKSHFLKTQDQRYNPNLQETFFKSYYKDNQLFVGIVCFDNQIKELKAQVRENGKDIWHDDTIELFINSGRTATDHYLHIVLNPLNSLIKEIGKGKLKKEQLNPFVGLIDGVKTATFIGDTFWSIEIEIPLSQMKANQNDVASDWGFNITRFRPQKPSQPSQSSSWSDLLSYDFHQPGKFGLLWLRDKNPIDNELIQKIESTVINNNSTTRNTINEKLLNTNWDCLTEVLAPEIIHNISTTEFNDIRDAQVKTRNENWNKLFQTQGFPKFQNEMRQNFIKNIGDFPERTPLNAKLTRVHQNDSYEIFNLLYESMPGHYVTANLYQPIPSGNNKIPVILKLIGHSTPGKNSKNSLSFGDHLARQGYAVLIMDSLGQGERIYVNQGNGSRTPTSNHYAMGSPCVLLGQNIAKYFVWDAIRAIDFIIDQPQLDANKIIVTGESGGGTVTSYVAALDTRVAGAASCSAMGSDVHGSGGHDCEQQLANCYSGCFDAMGRTAMVAPRPYVILGEYGSEEGLKRNYEMVDQAKMAFRFFGKENNLEYYPTKEPHGYGPGHRKIFYTWLSKYFPANNNFAMNESKPLFNDTDALRVTKNWQVYFTRELRDRKTLHALNDTTFEKIQKGFSVFYQNNNKEKIRQTLLSALQINPSEATALPITILKNEVFESNMIIKKCLVKVSATISLPLLLLQPEDKPTDKIVIWINQRGKDVALKSRFEEIKTLLANGYTVCLPDLRGMGELASDDLINHFSYDTDLSFFSIKLGASYLGRVVLDTWRIQKSIKLLLPTAKIFIVGDSLSKQNPIHIRQDRLLVDDGLESLHIAESFGPLVALFLTAIEPECESAIINGSLSSYGNVFKDFYFYHPVSTFVNGIATKIDIPEICLAISPRKLVLLNTVNAKNQPIQKTSEEWNKYQKVKEFFSRNSASTPLKIIEGTISNVISEELK